MRSFVPLLLATAVAGCGSRVSSAASDPVVDAAVAPDSETAIEDSSTPEAQPIADTSARPNGFPVVIDGASVDSIAVGPGDQIFAVGNFRGTAPFGPISLASAGGQDAFLARFDRDGRVVWAKRFGDAADQTAHDVVATADGGAVVAFSSKGTIDLGDGPIPRAGNDRDALVASFDASGKLRWRVQLANSNQLALARDATGGVVVCGSPYEPVDLGMGPSGASFLFALGADGAMRWAKRFGGPRFTFAMAIAVDDAGAIWVVGGFDDELSFEGGAKLVAPDSSGDAFVAKFGVTGEHLWSRRFGGDWIDRAHAIAIAPDGHAIVAGEFAHTVDFGTGAIVGDHRGDIFVMDLASDGRTTWARSFSTAGWDTAYRVKVSAGSIAVAGHVGDASDLGDAGAFGGSLDALVLLLDRSGNRRSGYVTGGADYDIAAGLDFLSSGEVLVSGRFTQRADFGVPMVADAAGYLVRLTP